MALCPPLKQVLARPNGCGSQAGTRVGGSLCSIMPPKHPLCATGDGETNVPGGVGSAQIAPEVKGAGTLLVPSQWWAEGGEETQVISV